MAFVEHDLLSGGGWVLIGDNVTSITFQNVSQYPVYINFNNSTTAPTEEVGLVYGPYDGELKKDVNDMTFKTSPHYVFAKAIGKTTKVIVEV